MKKVILGLGITIGLFSCGTPAEKVEVAADSTAVVTDSLAVAVDTAVVVADTLAK
jgi:hypothetical protein